MSSIKNSKRQFLRNRITRLMLPWVAPAFIFASGPVASQEFPTKPVRIVVPYTAGGATDTAARILAEELSKRWSNRALIENKPGASGVLAANTVAEAAPDGHTLLFSDSSIFVIVPHIKSMKAWNFEPISVVARQLPVLVARKSLPVSDLDALLQYGKSNPDKLSYGTFGIGTWSHVAMEGLQQQSGAKFVHVPYRGTAQLITDALGGQIDVFFNTAGAVSQHVQTGDLKLLAVGTRERSPEFPNVPSIAEKIPDFSIDVWFGLVAPAGTPPAVINKIEETIREIRKEASYKAAFQKQSLEQGTETSQEFKLLLATQFDRWGSIVEKAGIRE